MGLKEFFEERNRRIQESSPLEMGVSGIPPGHSTDTYAGGTYLRAETFQDIGERRKRLKGLLKKYQ